MSGVATGKMVTLHARWSGDPPQVGDYLRSQGAAARFAYRIMEATPIGDRIKLRCERIRADAVPDGATLHVWKWEPRSPIKGMVWT